jgi:cytochrome c5
MRKLLFVGSVMAIALTSFNVIADGKATYDTSCAACHAAGVAGAPKIGDSGAWKDRVGQGMDALVEHAIKGFQGKAGFMPPKGGFANLTDDQVKEAVAYMIDNSK